MEINEALIDKLAGLAKLEFSGDEKMRMLQNLRQMLAFVSKIEEIDLTGIQPLIYMTDDPPALREDAAGTSISGQSRHVYR